MEYLSFGNLQPSWAAVILSIVVFEGLVGLLRIAATIAEYNMSLIPMTRLRFLFSYPGIFLHELAHAVVATLLFFPVTSIKFASLRKALDPSRGQYYTGKVEYFVPGSVIMQSYAFMPSLAPLLFLGALIWLSIPFVVEAVAAGSYGILALAGPLLAYLASALTPSTADISNVRKHRFVTYAVVVTVSVVIWCLSHTEHLNFASEFLGFYTRYVLGTLHYLVALALLLIALHLSMTVVFKFCALVKRVRA